jgi:hypothetical protein
MTAAPAPALPDHPDLATLCLFVGHPRSGHTLVGALLDAHPDVVLAQKLDVLRLAAGPGSPRALVGAILTSSSQAARSGRSASGYDYAVPGQWQGRYRTLRVVGDKSAGHTTARLRGEGPTLAELRRRLPLRQLLVHVVRDPLDNVSTLVRRGSFASVERAIAYYGELCDAVAAVEHDAGTTMHRLHLEDLLERPHEQLRALALALDVEAAPDWLDACAARLWSRAARTRALLEWTPAQLDAIAALVDRHPHWFRRGSAGEPRACE